MTLLFLILAAVTLSGAAAAMTLRRLVHCALALTVAFAGLATLFLSLDAQFAGLAQLLVYVGAIAILIVFAILLTPSSSEADFESRPPISLSGLTGGVLALGVFAILAFAVSRSRIGHSTIAAAPQTSTRQIGEMLMGRYVLPLEVVGLMLTAALIGAVILAMKESQAPR
jgi:NADH:ubiquinone oxidoreductase subunit 6 (subunit J)